MAEKSHQHPLSAAGVLISLGIIYGDIGTSPLYVINAIVKNHVLTEDLILGGLSCIIWTMITITSFKYVYMALNADNRGEGGIFALYALVRRYKSKWVIFPALIGCAALIADGFITPPISISSAVEGLRELSPNIPTVPIVIVILIILFTFQQFGTKIVGGIFGPIMLIWFVMIGVLGFSQLVNSPEVLKAVNPYYAYNLIFHYEGGIWFLGAVFLCTTGGEALYSDLGHCGKTNIRASWGFVKSMLLLSYLGQSAYLISHMGTIWKGEISPFYAIMPEWFLPIGILVATFATVIASQAMISGCFTLVNEAMKLKLWPNMRVLYPTTHQGQIYIPAINWFLFAGCLAVVFIFRESGRMEAAYGLAITIDMLMTTTLLTYFLFIKRKPVFAVVGFAIFFVLVEGTFFVSNLNKFSHGGWFTFLIAVILFVSMFVFFEAKKLRKKHTEFVAIKDYIGVICELQKDESIPKEATNLVYMAMANDKFHVDNNIIYSILKKKPKRADVYWFVHVDITSDPYGAKYFVETIIPKKCFFVRLKFGFKVEHKVHVMFNTIVEEMIAAGEVDQYSNYPSLRKFKMNADFKFIILNSRVAIDNNLSPYEQLLVKGYNLIKTISLSAVEDFGLERTNVEVEDVPIRIAPTTQIKMERMH